MFGIDFSGAEPKLVAMRPTLAIMIAFFGLSCQNTPPSVPIVTGPDKARPNDTLSFSALSVDRDGDSVSYLFSWNDAPGSNWSPWYPEAIPCFTERAFSDTGEFVLMVKARDPKDESGWSDSLLVRIQDYGPFSPKRPAGPDTVALGDTVGFVTLAYHPLNERVALQFDWGDTVGEWSQPVQPGSFFWQHHAWLQDGWFEVRARARDSSGHVSEWSDPESVLVVDTFSSRP